MCDPFARVGCGWAWQDMTQEQMEEAIKSGGAGAGKQQQQLQMEIESSAGGAEYAFCCTQLHCFV